MTRLSVTLIDFFGAIITRKPLRTLTSWPIELSRATASIPVEFIRACPTIGAGIASTLVNIVLA